MKKLIVFIPFTTFIVSSFVLIFIPYYMAISLSYILYVIFYVIFWSYVKGNSKDYLIYESNVLRLKTKNNKDIYFYKFDNVSDKLRFYKFSYFGGFCEIKEYELSLYKEISTICITTHLERVTKHIEAENIAENIKKKQRIVYVVAEEEELTNKKKKYSYLAEELTTWKPKQ